MKPWLALVAVTLMLPACAHRAPRIITKEVRVPIVAPCAPQLPPAPSYAADRVLLDGTVFDLVQALLVDREQRKAREAELSAAVEGCR
jgi:hypothetical protein